MAKKESARENTGQRGARRSPLDHQTKILLGKGAVKKLKPVNAPPWKGEQTVMVPFDKKQSEINRELGYW